MPSAPRRPAAGKGRVCSRPLGGSPLRARLLPSIRSRLCGRFEGTRELRTWVIVGYGLAIALTAVSTALLPADSDFRFFRSCVSNLGSPDAEHNPSGFLVFSGALIVMGITLVPLVLFRHARMHAALGTTLRMRLVTGFYLLGITAWVLTGVVPLSRDPLIGAATWDDVHNVIAKIAYLGVGTGLMVDTLALLIHRAAARVRGTPNPVDERLFVPYALAVLVVGAAVFVILTWQAKRAADPLLHWTGDGFYSFPFWEWSMTLTAPIVLAWVAYLWMHPRTGGDERAQVRKPA